MQAEQPYQVIAFYRFVPIQDPVAEVYRQKKYFKDRDIRGRIYISEEGINAQMSASNAEAEAYMAWMEADERFAGIHYKLDPHPEHAFAKMIVKYREQLAALDLKVDPAYGGEHVSPERWAEMLEDEQDYLLLDVRNDYEWDIGHFDGAIRPETETFRDFTEFTRKLQEGKDPKQTKVMMYCTGGIRCELFSAHMKKEGFDQVYQLDGGIINYGHKMGNKHWEGKLFVFDDRLAVPISEDEHSVIAHCHWCGTAADHPYNCANMDCNNLFISCKDCIEEHQGCCCDGCTAADLQ